MSAAKKKKARAKPEPLLVPTSLRRVAEDLKISTLFALKRGKLKEFEDSLPSKPGSGRKRFEFEGTTTGDLSTAIRVSRIKSNPQIFRALIDFRKHQTSPYPTYARSKMKNFIDCIERNAVVMLIGNWTQQRRVPNVPRTYLEDQGVVGSEPFRTLENGQCLKIIGMQFLVGQEDNQASETTVTISWEGDSLVFKSSFSGDRTSWESLKEIFEHGERVESETFGQVMKALKHG